MGCVFALDGLFAMPDLSLQCAQTEHFKPLPTGLELCAHGPVDGIRSADLKLPLITKRKGAISRLLDI